MILSIPLKPNHLALFFAFLIAFVNSQDGIPVNSIENETEDDGWSPRLPDENIAEEFENEGGSSEEKSDEQLTVKEEKCIKINQLIVRNLANIRLRHIKTKVCMRRSGNTLEATNCIMEVGEFWSIKKSERIAGSLWFKLVSNDTLACLQSKDNSTLVIADCEDSNQSQLWSVLGKEKGQFSLMNYDSCCCISTRDTSLVLTDCLEQRKDLWRIEGVRNVPCKIKGRKSRARMVINNSKVKAKKGLTGKKSTNKGKKG